MPFERYLRADDQVVNNSGDFNYYYQDHKHSYDDADCHGSHAQYPYSSEATHYDHHHPHGVQFQIPQFMLNGTPTLAPGGGAEVLPVGLLDSAPDSFASSWFANNGFTPFHSSLISRQADSGVTSSGSASSCHAVHDNPSQLLPPTSFPRFTSDADPRQRAPSEPPHSLEVAVNYIPDLATNPTSYAPSSVLTPAPDTVLPATSPSVLGLPVYSTSGLDVLSILSRVVNRPNPTIQLGPVDLSCSFLIVDVRRYDCPIVYASPTFCYLTGYSEQEVLGRNCRLLQSPAGNVAKGEPRRFVSPQAVSYMRKLLSSSKECQTTLINYRKGGQAFINLVTVIPLRGGVHDTPEEADEVAYHVGFQVDLTEQPTRILDRLRDGSHQSLNNSSWGTGGLTCNPATGLGLGQLPQAQNMATIGLKGGRHGQTMSVAVSKELRNLIADTTFTDSILISTATNMSGPAGASSGSADQGRNITTPLTMLVTPPSSTASMNRMSTSGNTMAGSIPVSLSPSLSLLLLEFLPDFLLVLSLKGAFLYVAPSVRLVLGYEPQELVGRSISDVCHPADLVPLMRELKEGSVSGVGILGSGDAGLSTGPVSNIPPKSVDLLFRALPKASTSPPHILTQTSTRQGDSPTSSQSSSTTTSCSSNLHHGTAPPYIWLECRGRLHVEPGKGRKAIILSGRARWMPVVRWDSVHKAGSIDSVWCQGDSTHGDSYATAGAKLCEISAERLSIPTDPREFWALLSSQGTFLVASANVREVLGWGTSEVIGRSICAMVKDSRGGMKERVEAELAKLDTPEARDMADPPPLVVTTSLTHRESHTVPVRLAFYRSPQSDKRSLSSTQNPSYPRSNPLCPIVCRATVLSDAEVPLSKRTNTDFGSNPNQASSQVQTQIDVEGFTEGQDTLTYSSGTSLFEELETVRGSSWQYKLQQLKFANQRLHEEVHALEGACAKNGTVPSSSTTGRIPPIQLHQPRSSPASTATIPIPPHSRLHYTPLIHSTVPTPPSSLRPPNSLHERDPPPSDWSSLANANGQGLNPLKRSRCSEDGPTA